jgi:hypothetical protein
MIKLFSYLFTQPPVLQHGPVFGPPVLQHGPIFEVPVLQHGPIFAPVELVGVAQESAGVFHV